jgi:hypothetical protein
MLMSQVKIVDCTHLAPNHACTMADWILLPGISWGTWDYAYHSSYLVRTKDGTSPSSSVLMVPGTFWEDHEQRSLSEALAIIRAFPGAKTRS